MVFLNNRRTSLIGDVLIPCDL